MNFSNVQKSTKKSKWQISSNLVIGRFTGMGGFLSLIACIERQITLLRLSVWVLEKWGSTNQKLKQYNFTPLEWSKKKQNGKKLSSAVCYTTIRTTWLKSFIFFFFNFEKQKLQGKETLDGELQFSFLFLFFLTHQTEIKLWSNYYPEEPLLLTAQGQGRAPIMLPLMSLKALRFWPGPTTNFPPPPSNPPIDPQ